MSSPAKEVAKSILRNMKHHYQSPYTLLDADEREFTHLQLNAYQQSKSQLEKYEFRHISDTEILEITSSPNSVMVRTFIRSMVSSDGSMVSEYYQVKPRLVRITKNLIFGLLSFRFIAAPLTFFATLKTKHIHGFETEFTDGTFITTSNAQDAGKVSMPVSIDATYLPYKSSIKEVLIRHRERVREKLKQNPNLTYVPVRSRTDFLAMQARLKRQKDAHRTAVNWITKEELEKFGTHPELAEAVIIEVQNLLNQQSKS